MIADAPKGWRYAGKDAFGRDTYSKISHGRGPVEVTERKGKALDTQEIPCPCDSISLKPKRKKPLLNQTESRWLAVLQSRSYNPILQQAITLRLDPPFKSYRADLAYVRGTYLTLVEVKGIQPFARAGIAKAAVAAKTYPQFRFELAEWTKEGWKESVLSP